MLVFLVQYCINFFFKAHCQMERSQSFTSCQLSWSPPQTLRIYQA